MKRLAEILTGVEVEKLIGDSSKVVLDLKIDSRGVGKEDLFFAVPGTQSDGHQYVGAAIDKGAGVIVCERMPENIVDHVTYVKVRNVVSALSAMTLNFFNHPDRRLKLIGVTGTNGKTTIATLLYALANKLGKKAGLISTIEYKVAEESFPSTHTTPDIISLARMFRIMVDRGCEYAFMEVSSHAIDQGRIEGLDFAGGIFTNITHDHLDYHKTFRNYIYAKKKFFDNLKKEAFALTNIDDPNGKVMLQNTAAGKLTYGLEKPADYKAKILGISLNGLYLKLNDKEAHFKLTGKFNAYNILAVFGAATELGWDEHEVLIEMSVLEPIKGRFEIIYNENLGVHAVVDFAHTPDALINLLSSIRKIKSKEQRIISVIGAGGNRDKGKRPLMGSAGAGYSDLLIVTSDNPRFEDPEEIIKDILDGVGEDDSGKVISIIDRKEAIKTAILMANRGDVIVVAGKGHENYQIIGVKTVHFSDREVIEEVWKNIIK